MSLGVSLLGLFMTVFYLFVVATKLEAEITSGGAHTPANSVTSSATRLFLLNGPLNAGSSAVGNDRGSPREERDDRAWSYHQARESMPDKAFRFHRLVHANPHMRRHAA